MKPIKITLPFILFSLLSFSVFSQSNEKQEIHWKTDTITVYGNCEMCKATIEASLKKKDGIKSREWNKTTKKLIVTYNPDVTNLDAIHQHVAASGYDTEKAKAPDEAYNKLHSCCQYKRK